MTDQEFYNELCLRTKKAINKNTDYTNFNIFSATNIYIYLFPEKHLEQMANDIIQAEEEV